MGTGERETLGGDIASSESGNPSPAPSPSSSDEELLAEQRGYYRARAAEYDEWWLRQGRYDRGEEATALWFEETARVEQALADFGPRGDVLEIASGTGLWTARLAVACDSILAVDAAPEAIAIARERVPDGHVTWQQADLFKWRPERRYDLVFFSFWLSHVPEDRFDAFWDLVASALKPDGRVFFIDSLYTQGSTAADHWLPDRGDGIADRKLNDGRRYRVVKIFYEPEALQARLASLGWAIDVRVSGEHFLYGAGRRAG